MALWADLWSKFDISIYSSSPPEIEAIFTYRSPAEVQHWQYQGSHADLNCFDPGHAYFDTSDKTTTFNHKEKWNKELGKDVDLEHQDELLIHAEDFCKQYIVRFLSCQVAFLLLHTHYQWQGQRQSSYNESIQAAW